MLNESKLKEKEKKMYSLSKCTYDSILSQLACMDWTGLHRPFIVKTFIENESVTATRSILFKR